VEVQERLEAVEVLEHQELAELLVLMVLQELQVVVEHQVFHQFMLVVPITVFH
jgi:hypothetical protein